MSYEIQMALSKPFDEKRIRWRMGQKSKDNTSVMPLAYIDARDVMNRLDEVMGVGGWQSRFHQVNSKTLMCDLGLRIGGDWVWRSDGAGETQVEGEKGQASDALKRAAVHFGVGRYLYYLDAQWVPVTGGNERYPKFTPPALPGWATPEWWVKHRLGATSDGWSEELASALHAIKGSLREGDMSTAAECWFEMSEQERGQLWTAPTKNGPFSTREREIIQSTEFREAHYGAAA